MTNLEELEKTEERILQTEKRIEEKEAEILSTDQLINDKLKEQETGNNFLNLIYKQRFFISLVVTVSVALVWQGVGSLSAGLPVISTSLGALVVGVFLLWLMNRLAGSTKK